MKAIVWVGYGSTDALQLKEMEKPIPKNNEVLVKVHAASINSWDLELLGSRSSGLGRFLKPKYKILGTDIAGRVETVGKNVKMLQKSDEVFGDLCYRSWGGIPHYGGGGFAEYVCTQENSLSLKPTIMTFEEAAAIPQAGILALQSVQKGHIQKGQKVLINGAGGGVGTFAVQIAKSFGAEVTGVDSAEKQEIMSSIGADHVINYTKKDFTKNGQAYDLIIDVAAHHSVFDYKRSLSHKGICVLVGGSSITVLQVLFFGSLISWSKKICGLLYKPNKDLDYMLDLIETGKVKPIIDRFYSLSEVPDAFRYFKEGKVKGKIVVKINDEM